MLPIRWVALRFHVEYSSWKYAVYVSVDCVLSPQVYVMNSSHHVDVFKGIFTPEDVQGHAYLPYGVVLRLLSLEGPRT